ncbi:MbnP family protein [Flavobacterium sp. RSB2_4_14]|uniref:MbnP family protein n=1 Tax=Flavobacterium sp. RSB2_4_14 TaxID=3447665 RepID=UPI003F381AB5
MTKKNWLALLVLFTFQFYAQSNDTLRLNFKVNFDKFPLELNKKFITTKKDTVTLTTFKCYISNIEIQYSDKTVFKQKNSYHLIDLENPNSFQIPLTKKNDKQIARVIFNIGIDSLTSTAGALSGDLDPTKGMYWAWQSGYINMKIEGNSPSCNTRKNEFQFHIGGYLQPYYAIRKKVFTVNQSATKHINIGIDASIFFAEINLAKTNSVMIPGKIAMELADISAKMFYLE